MPRSQLSVRAPPPSRPKPNSDLSKHTFLQEKTAGVSNPTLATAVKQPASSEPYIAKIACKPGSDGVQPTMLGGQGLAGLTANFTGV